MQQKRHKPHTELDIDFLFSCAWTVAIGLEDIFMGFFHLKEENLYKNTFQ